ncbi:MAG: hypothetical protein AAGA71_01620 [Pseudomonadota bacterium]
MSTQTLVKVGLFWCLIHVGFAVFLNQASESAVWANTGAFLISFWIAFFGHLAFLDPQSAPPIAASARRLVMTLLASFMLNQSLLLTLVSLEAWSESGALVFSTAIAAFFILLLSKIWVFRRTP